MCVNVQVYVFTYSQESKCGGDPMALQRNSTYRNTTSIRLSLADFCYRVIVFPVNHKAWGPGSNPLYFTFTRFPRRLTVLSGLTLTHPHTLFCFVDTFGVLGILFVQLSVPDLITHKHTIVYHHVCRPGCVL